MSANLHAAMETITIHEAKPQLSRLIKKACRGEEIVIARGKEPVVKVPFKLPPKSSRISYFTWHDDDEEFDVIPVTVEHGIRRRIASWSPKDPFDRMLIAQALAEPVPPVSNDRALDGYGVKRLWSSNSARRSPPDSVPSLLIPAVSASYVDQIGPFR